MRLNLFNKKLFVQRVIQFVLFLLLLFTGKLMAQPAIEWEKSYGESLDDAVGSIYQTSDGGYIVGGSTWSGSGINKSETSRGGQDIWIIKLNTNGVKEWEKTFGSSGDDGLNSIQQTSDGGYILGGSSDSGIGGEKTDASRGESDYWIIKLNSQGVKQWDKTIGSNRLDVLLKIRQTPDGGYILGGTSKSDKSSEKSENLVQSQNSDFWIVKLKSNGIIEWDKTIGTASYNTFSSLDLTFDGGYILGGYNSYGETVYTDYWIVKVNAAGNKMWDKVIAGNDYDELRTVQQTSDGGYILGGYSKSSIGIDKSETNAGFDYWIVKLSSSGTKEWDKTLGGSATEFFGDIKQTSDGGYILGGASYSVAGLDKTENTIGGTDIWIVKLAGNGTKLWDKTLGGNSVEYLTSIIQTLDGGFAIGGYSNSNGGGNKTSNGWGGFDYWIVKLAAEQPPLPVELARFSVQKENSSTMLSWLTASEIHSDRFEVQHSKDGKSWKMLESIHAKGESQTTSNYYCLHADPAIGFENFYRLKMIDANNSFTYSKIQSIFFDAEDMLSFYPNPVTEAIYILTANWNTIKHVQLINASGITVYNSDNLKNGIDVKKLNAGTYGLKIMQTNGNSITKKVVIVK